MTERGWGRRFEDPIRIGDRVLVTLLDAGEYIAALPKKEYATPELAPQYRHGVSAKVDRWETRNVG